MIRSPPSLPFFGELFLEVLNPVLERLDEPWLVVVGFYAVPSHAGDDTRP